MLGKKFLNYTIRFRDCQVNEAKELTFETSNDEPVRVDGGRVFVQEIECWKMVAVSNTDGNLHTYSLVTDLL